MLLEQLSYSNRWRRVHPGAKVLFSLCGIVAASLVVETRQSLLITALLVAVTILGARIPLNGYLKVIAAPVLFLLVSGTTLAVTIALNDVFPFVSISFTDVQIQRSFYVCSRSLACLSSLLFLAFTTPLNDLISLMRRFHSPAILTDLMTLCFRTLFVFSEAIHDVATAQSARLGYSNNRNAMKSLGMLIAALILQVWQRSLLLHQSALSRGNDGPLYFLTPEYHASFLSFAIGGVAGAVLILIAVISI